MERIPEQEVMDIPERAQAYADADFDEVNAAFVERLLEIAGDRETCLALDLGTGPGEIPLRIAALRPGWRIVGLDASLPMLRLGQGARAESASGCGTQFVLADAKGMPYADGTFDLVFSNSLLHHVEDPVGFWREAARVAKPEATVFLRDLARPDSAEAAEAIVETYAADEHPLLKEDFYNSLLAAYTLNEVREQAERSGVVIRQGSCPTERHLDIVGTVAH